MNIDTGADVKAFEMKLDAELEKAEARMQQLAVRARESKAKAQIDALEEARHLVHKIDKKRESLREATGKEAAEVRAEIETTRAKLTASLEHVASKLKA